MSRRQLIGGAAVLAAAVIPSVGRMLTGSARNSRDPVAARLLALVDASALRPLGQVYVRQLPASASAFSVARDILPSRYDAESVLDAPPSEVLGALAAASHQEHRRGIFVVVDGWMLSPTEANLCALSVLHG